MAEAVSAPFDRPDAGFNQLEGWTWIGCYGGYYLQADLLQEFEHGFFTRQWEDRGPEVLAGYVSAGVSVHRPKQVHSALVLPASEARCEPWPEADGLYSDVGGQSLWVCGADCTPVLIADPVSGRVAACHAGWRGLAGGILLNALELLEQQGCSRSALLVALGPAVSGPQYQVELEVVKEVARVLQRAQPTLSDDEALEVLERCGAVQPDPDPTRRRLDLRLATQQLLQLAGLPASQISSCPLCTVSEPLLFRSWRRDQIKAVQWSGIVSQQES
ncbi:peptidoglycan editing factor PgeF [Vulcanococcus sp.]|uniref:peptidoglycan editing factor PgeF n=1 Tax=Vulcanococcus sp. TaxID=2856995 RepID=UPI003BFDE50D